MFQHLTCCALCAKTTRVDGVASVARAWTELACTLAADGSLSLSAGKRGLGLAGSSLLKWKTASSAALLLTGFTAPEGGLKPWGHYKCVNDQYKVHKNNSQPLIPVASAPASS